jgi:hypothetical protein
MASPGGPTKDEKASADFRSMSDQDFARLSIEGKFRHVHLGMRELAQALDELAAARKGRGQLYGAKDDLCVACISLVGGDRNLGPHPELRQAKPSTDEALFQCAICEAWWSIQKLGWGRLTL